jgi:hypothetical protein
MNTFTRLGSLLLASSLLASAQDFRSLFNGKDLSGWKGEGYEVVDGTIVCTPKGTNLITTGRYSRYILDFEFRLPPAGNNGLALHYPGSGDAAYVGMECQILDDTHEKYKDLKDYQFHGSLYTLQPAKKAHLKPVGEWNHERVTVMANTVKVELNGTVILEANLDDLEKKFPKHQGVKRRSGHIGWCGHGDAVAFRNIKIAELPPAPNTDELVKEGFKPLFDGTSLEHWKVEPGSESHWVPANGVLKYDGDSKATIKDLWSVKSFGDVTMVLDWRWNGLGQVMNRPVINAAGDETGETLQVEELDSGIYLRGDSKSQVNLWNWPAGSGEVYGYRTNKSLPPAIRAGVTPKEKADRPVGEWNHMEITMKGDRLTVVLNGKKVIENAQLPGVAAKGPVGLQHHGSSLDFANIWIKEL